MEYRVILTKNGIYKKTLHKSHSREDAFFGYRDLIKENENIMFEKKFINYQGICPVKYMLYVVKTPQENDVRRFVKDKFGKTITEELLFNKWIILNSIEYRIEENLWIYGDNPKTERKTIRDVVKLLMKGLGSEKTTKEIIVCHNKLIIYNEEDFDMIICKCISDAQRLHHLLYSTVKSIKIKGLLFMGTASPATTSYLYDIIHEETGWPYEKIRRTSTRP